MCLESCATSRRASPAWRSMRALARNKLRRAHEPLRFERHDVGQRRQPRLAEIAERHDQLRRSPFAVGATRPPLGAARDRPPCSASAAIGRRAPDTTSPLTLSEVTQKRELRVEPLPQFGQPSRRVGRVRRGRQRGNRRATSRRDGVNGSARGAFMRAARQRVSDYATNNSTLRPERGR